MPRPALMEHPIRLHVSLEKDTLLKLRKIAGQRAKSLTGIIRELAESYAAGRLAVPEKNLEDVVARMDAMRRHGKKVRRGSEDIIREMRGSLD